MPITIFGVTADRPTEVPDIHDDWLPTMHRHLVQRIELHASAHNTSATLLFDGIAGQQGNLVGKYNRFLYRSAEGQACTHITDAPFFVDSKQSIGIQIADVAASVIRIYEENNLYRASWTSDPFLLAIKRYHEIVSSLTKDYESIDGFSRPGLHRLGAEAHFPPAGDSPDQSPGSE